MNKLKCLVGAALVWTMVIGGSAAEAGTSVATQHYDNNRTGANLAETQLNTSNVNSTRFGRLFDYEVDGEIYAQPLIIQGVNVPGLGVHNVVYVATMNNSVYAFDADSVTNATPAGAPLWSVNFNNPGAGITAVPSINVLTQANFDALTPVGIVGTPVIDTVTGTMYLVAFTLENGNYVYRLHALDITSGAERAGSPVAITGSVPGTGYDAVNGVVTFNPFIQMQRPALALASGRVVVTFGSFNDQDPWHGWVMTYDESTLHQVGIFCTTPNGQEGGIWQSGQGPVVDATGNVYLASGNGTWDGVSNFGESLLKLNVLNAIAVADWFTPDSQATLTANDLDLGVSGPLAIPGTSLLLQGSKTGDFYLVNSANMGQLVTGNGQIPQDLQAANGEIHGSPVYFPYSSYGPLVYVWSDNDVLKAYHFNGSTLDAAPVMTSTFADPPGDPGGILAVSANGNTPGTGIVWVNMPQSQDAVVSVVQGVLRAFDASNLSTELWDSTQNPGTDAVGNFAKYAPPVVANGKVYLATLSNKLRVYGLLAAESVAPVAGSLSAVVTSSSAPVNLTALGTSDWAHWPEYTHKATGGAQISNYVSLTSDPVSTYTDDARVFSWSDGTPTASASTTNGVQTIAGFGAGFKFTAPADTNVRTLTVFVRTFDANGQFHAFLSDGSAEDYINVGTDISSGVTTYSISYSASSPGQTLTVEWTEASSVGGHLMLAAAALSGGASAPAPAAPTGVTATQGTSTTAVTLTWPAVTNASSYVVYRSTASGTPGSSIATPNTNSYTDATVVPGTTYYYAVVAVNSNGSSAASAQVSGYAAAPSTGAAGALSGSSAASSSAVNLTTLGTADWAAWPGYIHKASGGAQISSYSKVSSATVATFGDSPRQISWTDGTPTLSSVNTSGVYIPGIGGGFQFTVPADTAARTLQVYVGGWLSGGQLTAHLSDGSAADYVDSSNSSSGTYVAVYTLNYQAASAGQTLTVTWLQTSGAGNVTLQAATLEVAAAVPGVPTGLTASQGASATGVALNWTASANATSYTVYRSTTSGTQGTSVGTPTTATFTDTTVVPGTVYYYSVSATDAIGTSAASAQVSGYAGTAAPAVPTGLAASQGTSATSVALSWTASANATSYTVYRSSTSGTQGTSVGTPTTPAFTDTTVVPGTTYYYAVTAKGAGGTSAASAQVTGYAVAAPAAPTGLGASQGASTTSVTASWTASANATSYTVYRSVTSGTPGSALGTTTTTSYTDTTVVPGTTYYYAVSATGAGGTSAASAQVSGYAALPTAGTLSGSNGAPSTSINLTSVGTTDWAAWPSYVHKATGGGQIGNFTAVGTGTGGSYGDSPRQISWTDGTPTVSSVNNNGVYIPGIGSGFQFTVPADTTPRSVQVYVGGWASGGQLTAHLSDGAAANYVDSSNSSAGGTYTAIYKLNYQASKPGQTLTVSWVQTSGYGNVTLQAATLALTPGIPAAPTGVTASQGTSASSVTVGWTASANATSYTVYRSTSSGTQGTAVGAPTAPTFTDTTVVAGTSYYYSVTATGAGGTSVASAQVSGYASLPTPAAPTAVTASQGTSTSAVTISWTPSTNATSYTVYRSATAGTQGASVGTPTTPMFTDTTVVAGTTYYYSVTATGTGGTSAVSAQVSGYAAIPAPTAPAGVTASQGTSTSSVTLSWTAPANATSYTVFRSTTSGVQGASVGTPTTPAFTDTTVAAGTKYYYSVTATGSGGTSAASVQVSGYALLVKGSLAGSGALTTAAVNLTGSGSTDWAHWPEYTHKATGGSEITNFSTVGSGVTATYFDDARVMGWTDGAPTVTGSSTSGSYVSGIGNGFQFTVPAGTTSHTLTVYVGGWASGGTLTAHLSDGSAADYVDTSFSSPGASYYTAYTITFAAASAGQTLTIKWVQGAGYGNVTLEGATLQ